MPAHLEIRKPSGNDFVELVGDRALIGKGRDNDVVVAHDPTVSRRHAAFERYGAGWSVRDLGSRNGTTVNGDRILVERILYGGDEIRLGSTRILFRSDEPAVMTETSPVERAPELTPRERDILVSLCRPVLSDNPFTEPATVKHIAAELVVTEAAVKQHLGRLYGKFDIFEERERRRYLANEAIRRGAVTIADLRDRGM